MKNIYKNIISTFQYSKELITTLYEKYIDIYIYEKLINTK